MKIVFGLILGMLFVYSIIPSIISRLGYGAFRKSRTCPDVAFTFDDGPDPRYTPRLLELLKKHHVKATFFVLGSKAEQFPELIQQMHQEGHLIGIHNFVHRSNWLMTPWITCSDLNRTATVIERITGVRPVYYRPPWGLLNLFDLFTLRRQFRIILWSVMVGDWRSKGGSEKIKRRLLKKIAPGAVIVLHDSGETFGANVDAPLYTIEALEDVFRNVQQRMLSCVRIDDLIPFEKHMATRKARITKRLLVYAWMQWEKLFHKVFHIQTIDPNNPFFQVRVRIYSGKTVQLSDGEQIQKGDCVVELHFNNEMLVKMVTQSRSHMQLAVQMIRAAEQLLPKILDYIVRHPDHDKIKGLYGITMIYRGGQQLGFTVTDLPKGVFSFFTNIYLRILMFAVHPEGKQRLQSKTSLLIPKTIAISKKELMRRYG